MSRATLTAQWIEEYQNKSGGPWLGRATMEANKAARVASVEQQLRTIHLTALPGGGHGPYVINHKTGSGPAYTVNQTIADARSNVARTRRCICGLSFSTITTEVRHVNTTYDGFTRDLKPVPWPGFVWEGPDFPDQPRDTDAIRGVTVQMPTMIEGIRPSS